MTRATARFAFAVGATIVASGTAAAQPARQGIRAVPDFDIRRQMPPAPASPDVQAAIDRLRGIRSARAVRTDRVTGALRSIVGDPDPLTAPAPGSATSIAGRFIDENLQAFGLTRADARTLVLESAATPANTPFTRVTFGQQADGISVFGAHLIVTVDRAGRVIAASSSATRVEGGGAGPAISAFDAVRRAAAHFGFDDEVPLAIRQVTSGRDQATVFERGVFGRDVVARLVHFPLGGSTALGWLIVLQPDASPSAYDIVIDASDGRLLFRRNRVRDANGVGTVLQSAATQPIDPRRPDQHPTGSTPSGSADTPGGCPPLDNFLSRSITSQFRDSATVLGNDGRLHGNNANVYRGATGTWGALGTQDKKTKTWQFDFPFNSASSAETHLFFTLNFLHDFFYDLGFDEASGNFQANNFGRGGAGNDPLTGLARASGRNNATFEQTPDGQSSTMSMFLWDGRGCWSQDADGDGTVDIDGDYDADVIYHEFHHGVSYRLNADFTGPEADAIGEGGSDFFAYSIHGDTNLAEFAYPPSGIRQVNEKTYGNFSCLFFFFLFCEPHDNGEPWANLLWDMRERFRTDLVGGSDAAAIDVVHQLYLDGLRLAPGTPTMLDVRDAMLLADQTRFPSGGPGGSVNYCRMWEVFAGRGMGANALDTEDTGDYTVVEDYAMPAACPAPPKSTVSIAVTQATASEAGTTPATVLITRTDPVDASLAVRLASGGTAASGADYPALPTTIQIPAGASSVSLDIVPIDDAEVESNETVTITIAANPAKYIIGSPSAATLTIVSDDVAPDLQIAAFTVPSTGGAGSTVSVSDTTTNQGTGPSNASITRFYLSANYSQDATDRVIGERSVPALAVGASSTATTTLSIPADVTAGQYFIIAKTDADASNSELSEYNNERFAWVAVGPDLIVSALTGPSAAGAGSSLVVSDTIANQGAGNAGASTVRYYLSTDFSVDASDAAIGSRPVGALNAGASGSGTASLTIPSNAGSGTYYVIAVADGNNQVSESQETNNNRFMPVQIGADLVPSALSGPSVTAPGASITVTDTITNQGGGAAAASEARFYLSTNLTLDGSDVFLGSRAVPSLNAGTSSSGSTTVTVPSNTGGGAYFIIAQADGGAAVAESNESNNTRTVNLSIGPDLVVSSLSAPAFAAAGAAITVTDTTKNLGPGSAAGSTTAFYLSVNGWLDGPDIQIGTRSVPALSPGATSTAMTTIAIPADTPAGTYSLIAQADSTSAVGETQELNNGTAFGLSIGPDLVVTALTVPGVVVAGATVTVSDTVRNQGASGAGATTTRYYFSVDPYLDASDMPIGMRSVAALAAGASDSGSASVTIPSNATAGNYNIIARTDDALTVSEAQESNNTKSAPVQLGGDLIIATITAPAGAAPGAPIAVTDTTKNQGATDMPGSTTGLYLSNDLFFDASDTPLGTRSVPPLAAGASSAGTTTVTIPANATPATYYVLAVADAPNALVETSEWNNVKAASILIGGDLAITASSAPGSTTVGATIVVTDTTTNKGTSTVGATTTRYYLSSNNYWVDGADFMIGSRAVAALDAGASSADSTSLVIPTNVPPGGYYLIIKTDADGAAQEAVETNNERFMWIQVGA